VASEAKAGVQPYGYPPAGRAGATGEEMISARSWTAVDDEQLRALLAANRHVAVIARELKRTEASVLARGYKLGLRLGRQKSLGLAARKTVPLLEVSPPGTNAIDD
jgi:hypothetical protein